MNHDDPGPSSAARQLLPSDREHDDAAGASSSGTTSGGSSHAGEAADISPAPRQRERRREGLAKKLEFVSHLQKTLDMIVVVYICTIYSME